MGRLRKTGAFPLQYDMKYIGADLSTWLSEEELGAAFYDHGQKKELTEILKDYGFNSVRLRLWNDPNSEDGEPYGAGDNDLKKTIQMAKRVKKAGMSFLLDIHYSDFWTDPGKQFKPKAWEKLSYPELVKQVETYTTEVVRTLCEEGCEPDLIQVGNELSNGLLWPDGKVPEYRAIAEFVSSGIKGVREVLPSVPIMIHLDNGGKQELYRTWFDNYMKYCEEEFPYGLDFQIIGLSYYPFWHGTLAELEANMRMVEERYHKELVVAEVSMGFTMEDYSSYEKIPSEKRKGMATREELVARIEYPMTEQGQADFMKDLLTRLKSIPEAEGFYYWEPAWIPLPGCGWATEASLRYMNDPGPCGNEWANQALFDYDGNALPAFAAIRDNRN